MTTFERHGRWHCGRLTLTRGRWQLGFTQDLLSFKIGISFWRLCLVDLTFLCWSIDLSRLSEEQVGFLEYMSQPTPPDIVEAINRDLFKLL